MDKLVVKEFDITEDITKTSIGEMYKVGDKYSYFFDPSTGKYYRPKEGFEVTGDLKDKFIEVKE